MQSNNPIRRSESAGELTQSGKPERAVDKADQPRGLLRVSSRLADAALSGRMDAKAVTFCDGPTQVKVFTKASHFERDALWYDHTHNTVMRLDVTLENLQGQIDTAKSNPTLSKSRSLQRKLNQLDSQIQLCRQDIASNSDMPSTLMGLRTLSGTVRSLQHRCALVLGNHPANQTELAQTEPPVGQPTLKRTESSRTLASSGHLPAV